MADRITCILVEAEQKPKVVQLDNDLKSLQDAVGGYIEAVYPFDEDVGIICNEDGVALGLPLNRALFVEGELRDKGEMYDVIKGNFLVVGLTEEDFGSLTDEQLKKYFDRFARPEYFIFLNGHLAVCK